MADFLIRRSQPSELASEIQALFVRAGKPGFSEVYERVYRVRERRGLRSWVGLSGDRASLHISVAPEPFSDGVKSLTCGLLGDLMVDETDRDFWGPLKLVRRMASDVRSDQMADFLLTTYTPAAEGLFKAAGFRPYAVLRRGVMPLLWPYRMLRRAQLGRGLLPVTAVPFRDGWSEVPLHDLRSPGCFRPVPHEDYYATRIPRLEYPTGTWILMGEPASPDAIVLVSPKPPGELRILDVLWRDAAISLPHVLASLAQWASRQYKRLVVNTIEKSRLAIAARRAGFLDRPDTYVIMMAPISQSAVIPPPEDWTLTPFIVTSW